MKKNFIRGFLISIIPGDCSWCLNISETEILSSVQLWFDLLTTVSCHQLNEKNLEDNMLCKFNPCSSSIIQPNITPGEMHISLSVTATIEDVLNFVQKQSKQPHHVSNSGLITDNEQFKHKTDDRKHPEKMFCVYSPPEKELMLVNRNHKIGKLPVCNGRAVTREESRAQTV